MPALEKRTDRLWTRAFVLVGITNFLMFFAFYATTIGCLVLSRLGYLPAIPAAFLPDAVFLGIGLYLFHRQR